MQEIPFEIVSKRDFWYCSIFKLTHFGPQRNKHYNLFFKLRRHSLQRIQTRDYKKFIYKNVKPIRLFNPNSKILINVDS